MATKLIVDDVHANFEAYKAVPQGTNSVVETLPHCKIVLKRNELENDGNSANNSSYSKNYNSQGSN